MKVKISELMNELNPVSIDAKERTDADVERIRELTLNKIRAAHRPVKRLPKLAVVAAVLALCTLCTATVFACVKWTGFALTGGMTKQELRALLKEDMSGCSERIEPDGTVHYLNDRGEELFTLSAEEALEYERSKQALHEQTVQESTDLLDVTTLPLIPNSIHELTTDAQGSIPDFLLGNGHLVLLHPEDTDGYALSKGDEVTITMDASDPCIVEFGIIRDGVTLHAESAKAQQHTMTFSIPDDGTYCFYLMYYSADRSAFTNARLTIN